MGREASIDRVSYREFLAGFGDRVRRGAPVVTEAPPELTAGPWDEARLHSLIGDELLPILRSDTGVYTGRNSPTRERMTLSAYLDALTKEPTRHNLPGMSVEGRPALAGSVRLPDAVRDGVGRELRVTNFWIGGGGYFTGLHYDQLENLNVQLAGRKRFWIFPAKLPEIEPKSPFSFAGHFSRYRKIDELAEPARRRALERGAEFVLEAGEMLYLPFCWWHQVESLGGLNINVNYWWDASPRKMALHPRQMLSLALMIAYRKVKRIPVA